MQRPSDHAPRHPDPTFTEGLVRIFEEQIVFNRLLGLRITSVSAESVEAEILMRQELIGHFSHSRLHGGVISAGLDAMGGLAVMAAIGGRHPQESAENCLLRFNKLGTIDLRVDYLRPGKGERFRLSAEVLRLGSRVATTRMAFYAEGNMLIAAGTGTYIVS
jgi:uncharacterized protein (TIGR00369 family)